jgi:DNA replication initiation complex subunit (GINS family)
MLTFEAIRGIARKEKTSTKLIELPADFFPQTRAYLEKKSKMKREEDAWELNSAKQQLEDLINRREAKIVQAALQFVHSEVRPDNMASEEKWLFDCLVETIRDWQERKKDMLKAKRDPRLVLAMLDIVPKFMGLDMKSYGPFGQGDIATLPQACGKLLLEKGLARELSIKP